MGRRQTGRPVHGILLLDKRIGVSSNRALQEIKRLYNAAKAGHTGSLDPLATGLLPVCFGEATKVSGLLLDKDKRYRVEVKLGIRTDTGDLEGKVIETRTVPALDLAEIQAILNQYTGRIEQIPPMYSALKHKGRKLYELARAGKTVERPARSVDIFEISLLTVSRDTLTLEVHCSKGTYIRTLAEDIGQTLGCGATVQALRRLQTGEFCLTQAQTLEGLAQMDESQRYAQLIPVDEPLKTLPGIDLDQQQAANIRQGQVLQIHQNLTGTVRMYHDSQFLGLGEMRLDGKLAPKKLFIINN
jgi:tRNA pseudouridine55 synthase